MAKSIYGYLSKVLAAENEQSQSSFAFAVHRFALLKIKQ